jgi:hypothetical protein
MNLKVMELQKFSVFRNNSRIFADLLMREKWMDYSFERREVALALVS